MTWLSSGTGSIEWDEGAVLTVNGQEAVALGATPPSPPSGTCAAADPSSPVVGFTDPNLQFDVVAEYQSECGVQLSQITRAQIAQLMHLNASGSTSLEGLQYATGLKSLGVRALDPGHADPPQPDLTPILGLTNLTSLSTGSVLDLSAFSALTNLTDLDTVTQSGDLTPLESHTKLTTLAVTGDNIIDLSPLQNLPNLTQLSVGGASLSYIGPISTITGLTSLSVNAPLLTDLSPIASLTNLTSVSLVGSYSDLTPLAGLTKLTYFGTQSPNLFDFSPLGPISTNLYITDNLWLTLPQTTVGTPYNLPTVTAPDGSVMTPTARSNNNMSGWVSGNVLTWNTAGQGQVQWDGWCPATAPSPPCLTVYAQQWVNPSP